MRNVVKDERLRKSLISATAQMWHGRTFEEGQKEESRKYIFEFRFYDQGPHFYVTDKSTGIKYRVEMYEDWWLMGDKRLWGAYHT
jgi:hypothetical protein